ncbi:hypothetical protein RIF29_25671 [Crotalaria pallida]|uniref:Uncharacterized protein n=1 Tax=Crotalaria pallida TaxID=3830 RepID=A0AAN9EU57_CROPI
MHDDDHVYMEEGKGRNLINSPSLLLKMRRERKKKPKREMVMKLGGYGVTTMRKRREGSLMMERMMEGLDDGWKPWGCELYGFEFKRKLGLGLMWKEGVGFGLKISRGG